MVRKRPPIHRRRLLIDRAIQIPLLTYSVAMASVGILTASVSSVFWRIVVQSDDYQWASSYVLALGALLAFGLMIFVGLYLTNRIAGPLYRMREHMKAIADGANPEPIVSREDDYMGELFKEYNRLIEKISKK